MVKKSNFAIAVILIWVSGFFFGLCFSEIKNSLMISQYSLTLTDAQGNQTHLPINRMNSLIKP
jgi:hypothetical protein